MTVGVGSIVTELPPVGKVVRTLGVQASVRAPSQTGLIAVHFCFCLSPQTGALPSTSV